MNLKLPGNLKHYDGTERPDTWIEDYYNAVTFAGGTPNIACRMLQLYLVGPARIWLSDLEKNSIFCWFDLKTAFEKHFRGTNECENVDHTTAMYAFIGGLQRGGLLRHTLTHLANSSKLTLDEMISIASDHTAADDDAGGDLAAYSNPPASTKKNRDNGSGSSHKRKNPMTRRVADPRWSPWRFNAEVQEAEEDADVEAGGGRSIPRGHSGGSAPRKPTRSTRHALPAHWIRWSEIPCTFDRKDHPAIVPKECYALVVSPRIDGYDFSKCLMDGGASLNIMYLETLERMNLTKEQLKHSNTEFHGVSSYHVIFGRPTYHKFHARACYIYNKLKIPGPKELKGYRAAVDPTEMQTTKKQISEQKTSFKAAIETKKHDLIKGDSSKQDPFPLPRIDQVIDSTAGRNFCVFLMRIPGATYQRTMQRCLKDQIGRNVHAYIDDIAVMTRKGSDLISDLTETFDNLRSSSRVRTNAPLAATNKVISLVIVVERKEEGHEYDVQRPVYYISEVLTESKQRYPHFQKLAYGVFLGSRKLRHYFQEHPVIVVSKAPLSTILNNADATGRTAKWGIELSAFDIAYKPRTAVKSQVLADFIADWTEAPDASLEPEPETWVMHFDGSKQHQGSGAGVTLKSPTGEELQYVLQIHFKATNNMAEYEALLHGLRIAKEIGIKHIICCGDSDLVAQQVAGTWNARNSVMAAYRDEVDEIAKCFLGYEVKYIRRDDNTRQACYPSSDPAGSKSRRHFLEHLRIPSVKGANPENPEVAVSPAREVMAIIPAWTQPFLDYLIDQKLPEDEVLARQIVRRARSYTIVDGQLYKRSAAGVFLKCVSNQDGIEILREIHAGDCGHHAAPDRSLQKLFGFTPFFLVYGSEAVLPSDIIHDSPRVSAYNEETADEARQLSVDLIEEARNLADQRSAIYQQKLRRYHSRRVRNRSFMAGDLVLRLRQVKDHKLQSPWEGPFVVSKVLHNGSYYLVDFRELRDRPANWHRKRKREDPDDIYDETDRPWNIAQLRPFYT
ncbi:hypothetical protein QYE76_005354 [Lolium multiflorum]|uniref:Uncharacterized protein n=1 Tax=Lolium multiflorum TaxID=4521 RepID=A0AAD8W266_LOLMU|nr:hypothetical protein QYE76_005354 [Lolium multiflorum]